jgi:hypothetical protein
VIKRLRYFAFKITRLTTQFNGHTASGALCNQGRKVTESAFTTEITKMPRDDPLHTGKLELWQYLLTYANCYFFLFFADIFAV